MTKMEFSEWAIGLAAALDAAGKTEAAGVIRDMIGADGQSGVGKVVADYGAQNPLPLGEISVPMKVSEFDMKTVDGKTTATFTLSTNFGDGPGGGIIKGILAGMAITGAVTIGQ
jgi:hypothetical protein